MVSGEFLRPGSDFPFSGPLIPRRPASRPAARVARAVKC